MREVAFHGNHEMNTLIRLLVNEGIPFEVVPIVLVDEPSLQICYPNSNNCILDAVSHKFSYGGNKGLIELMGEGDITNYDVVGWLTANEALKYFKKAFHDGFED